MAQTELLGPPELRQYITAPSKEDDLFMNLMVSNFNKAVTELQPKMGFTENLSYTFLSSGNSCLDFFFHAVPNTPPDDLRRRLELAWSHDPMITLKLICHLRGVRGTGKSDKEGFYTSALWLHDHHPKTLAHNVGSIADFGYYKDLPELLYRLLMGSSVRKEQRDDWQRRKSRSGKIGNLKKRHGSKSERIIRGSIKVEKGEESMENPRVLQANERNKIEKQKASDARKEKRLGLAKKATETYLHDPHFRFLHECVSDVFAGSLKNDMKALNSNKIRKISLAAKWCPSLDSSFDRATLLCESIACKIFPQHEYPGVEKAHYVYRVRDRLRKEVLVPLRSALELPEVFMSARKWDLLPYNRVASLAMKLYKEKFMKHDKERFLKFLEDVKSGQSKIAAGALLPHEIVASLRDGDDDVAELQWKRMVDDLLKKGKLSSSLAICDVSGSMSGTPMEVSVALGVLVSEVSEEPWKGKLFTFSQNPKLQTVEGESLTEKTSFVRTMEWGMNTDFQKVFDLILQVAEAGKLKPEQMIKRVFVFSDMEFDQASANPWETDYRCILKKFSAFGYGDVVPEIVFWNLRNSRSTPVMGSQQGVALVSGFSKNLLKLFLNGGGHMEPVSVMMDAIALEEYQKLVVMD